MTTDPQTRRDLIEERAAILEFDAGLARADAELSAARLHGFNTWAEAIAATQPAQRRHE